MAYCEMCGTRVEDGQPYCPFCGAPIPEGQRQGETEYSRPGCFQDQDVKSHKVMAVLSYLGVLVLVPLLAGDKNSAYLRHHINQGFLLWIAGMFCDILSGNGVFGLLVFHLWPLSVVGDLMKLVIFILCVVGIVDACRGVNRELPLVGRIHII